MNMVLTTVLKTIREHNLLQKGDTVLVALSGGADSVALLHCMIALRDAIGLTDIRALHVHHGIRGEQADRDEQFVRDLCDSLSVSLVVKHVNVPEEVSKTGESVEDAARRLRYAFFEEESSCVPFSKIATAHTADDQAETVLLHLIRGSGLKGVSGIPIVRDRIIRPLLSCSADAVRDFCRECGFAFVVDETNFDLYFSRNRVRHEILPLMKNINPSVNEALIRFANLAAEDDRFLTSLAREVLSSAENPDGSYKVNILSEAATAVRRRSLSLLSKAEYWHILQMDSCLKSGGTVNLPNDISVVSDGTTLRILHHNRQKQPHYTEALVFPNQPIDFNGIIYIPRIISHEEYLKKAKIHKNLLNFCISYDMIKEDLVLRSRKPGDCLRPSGRGCTKTLKKLMNEHHIPLDKRQNYPVLASADKVLMVIGLCVDESVSIAPPSNSVLWFDILDHNKALE